MEDSLSAPRVAFVVHLQGSGATKADLARTTHVAHLFRMHRLPCTWSLAGCCSLEVLLQKNLLGLADELALAMKPLSEQPVLSGDRFGEALRQRLAAVQACNGLRVGLVSGNSEQLRGHAAVLAEQGLRGVIDDQPAGRRMPLTPLACGLWQINCGAHIPERTWIARLFSRGTGTLRQVARLQAANAPLVVSVDASAIAHSTPRQLQQLDNLLRQVSLSASDSQIEMVTAGQLVARLGNRRSSRPQQSILKAA
jgi:hypothetical protein